MTIGIDLGGTKIEVAKVNRDKIETTAEEATDKNNILPQIIRLVKKLAPYSRIGIGVPGQVREGMILLAPNLGIKNFPLKKELEAALKVPVTVVNDVQAGAVGEAAYGAAKGNKRVLVAELGTGIGGALLVEGQLLDGTAGEIGHMVIIQNGLPCPCGRKGCFEAYVGGWAIAQAGGLPSAKEVFETRQTETIQKAYHALLTGLANLINLYNPDKILLGGSVTKGFNQFYPDFFNRLQKDLQKEALHAAQDFILAPSTLSNVIGAAALTNSG